MDLRQKLTKVMQSRNEFLSSYLNDKLVQDDKNQLYEQNHKKVLEWQKEHETINEENVTEIKSIERHFCEEKVLVRNLKIELEKLHEYTFKKYEPARISFETEKT